jgi:hypothetical protein
MEGRVAALDFGAFLSNQVETSVFNFHVLFIFFRLRRKALVEKEKEKKDT